MSRKLHPAVKKEERNDQQQRSEEQYLYVYGIVNKTYHPKKIILGLNDKPIQKLNFNEISALFSYYSILRPLLKEEEVLKHAEIVKKIAHQTTVIPMSFGAVFKDQKILEGVLAKSHPMMIQTLALIKNKIELGVKVVKKPLGENQLEDYPNGVAKEIAESLQKLSIKSKEGDKFSDRLLVNSSFLVGRNKFSHFSDKIRELENKYPDLKFIYTGPWPLYSFVNIQIKGGT